MTGFFENYNAGPAGGAVTVVDCLYCGSVPLSIKPDLEKSVSKPAITGFQTAYFQILSHNDLITSLKNKTKKTPTEINTIPLSALKQHTCPNLSRGNSCLGHQNTLLFYYFCSKNVPGLFFRKKQTIKNAGGLCQRTCCGPLHVCQTN